MAITAAALKVGSMLAKTGGAIAKGGKMAMKKGGTVLKKSKKVAGNVKKAVIKKRKINKETFMSKDRAQKKKNERDKRKQEEELLEKRNNKEKKPNPSKIMKKGGGVLQKIIDFISTVLIGWVVVNLPKIIDSVKGVIKKIKDIYDKIIGFFGSFGEFFSGIKDVIGGTIDKLKNLDFSKIGDSIKEKIRGLKDAFTNLITDIGKGVSLVNSKKSEDPKKLGKTGLGGDATSNVNETKGKIDENKGALDTLKTETNILNKDTDQLSNNLNDAIEKGKNELDKIDAKVITKKISMEREVTGRFDLETGKTYINNKEVSADEYNKFANMSKKEQIQNYGQTQKFDTSVKKDNIISKLPTPMDLGSSITPQKKGKDIIIDNILPPIPPVVQQAGGGETNIIVLGKSLNSNIKESILTDAAYT
tara:strand:+ start:517 stop:1773 length:1257 start_codon:yes stop_codon:yes gene_type:complete